MKNVNVHLLPTRIYSTQPANMHFKRIWNANNLWNILSLWAHGRSLTETILNVIAKAALWL